MVIYREIIDRGEISHNEKLGVFTVLSTTGTPRVVRLFPKQSCSCPSSGLCYHIIAAQISIGLEVGNVQLKVNLTQLRRNSRTRKDKTSGRKRPRPGDIDIVAAPDSINASMNDHVSIIIIIEQEPHSNILFYSLTQVLTLVIQRIQPQRINLQKLHQVKNQKVFPIFYLLMG